jgi:putative transposase
MSGKGNGYDHSRVETVFKTLKSERVWRTAFQTRAEASQALARSIDGFSNPVRRPSALDFVSPAQFERRTSQTALHYTKASPKRHLARYRHGRLYDPRVGACGPAPHDPIPFRV